MQRNAVHHEALLHASATCAWVQASMARRNIMALLGSGLLRNPLFLQNLKLCVAGEGRTAAVLQELVLRLHVLRSHGERRPLPPSPQLLDHLPG